MPDRGSGPVRSSWGFRNAKASAQSDIADVQLRCHISAVCIQRSIGANGCPPIPNSSGIDPGKLELGRRGAWSKRLRGTAIAEIGDSNFFFQRAATCSITWVCILEALSSWSRVALMGEADDWQALATG
jgi:hypothetical protein